MRTILTLGLASILLLAGCLGSAEDEAEAVAPAASGAEEPTAPENEAATTAPTPEDEAHGEESSDNGTAPVVEPEPLSISWDGTTDLFVCVPAGPNMCMGPAIFMSGDDTHVVAVREIRSGTVTLEWSAATPLTSSLTFRAASATSCGDGCWSSTETFSVSASGTSPLTLDLGGATLVDEEELYIWVRPDRLPLPDPLWGYVSTEQPFHVEGELMVVK